MTEEDVLLLKSTLISVLCPFCYHILHLGMVFFF